MILHRISILATTLCSLACGKDLPAGWDNAQSVKSLTQAACAGSPGFSNGPIESIDVTASTRLVSVAYHAAHFRCAQSVEGFVRTGPTAVDVLVQPTDLNPSKLAGCDCAYDIALTIDAPVGPTAVSVYRRWDHKSGADTPLKIGTTSVVVP